MVLSNIELLQQKIAEQNGVITTLFSSLKLAQEQAQQIAHKALETSMQRYVIINPNKQN